MSFYQDPPQLKNQYDSDDLLQSYLARHLPPEILHAIEPDLKRFGGRVVGDIYKMGELAEKEEPLHIPFDPWGKRIDQIQVSAAWDDLRKVSAEEGLVAHGYERKYSEFSRLYQFAKLYLFTPSSAIYACPLAMTDGAARLIEEYGDAYLKEKAYPRLISRNPDEFWTSGQWMTEKTGGSDVGQSETIAKKSKDHFVLYGDKWFTSAMPSNMTMTLARIEDESGHVIPGSRGLSLFYAEVFDPEGKLNQIQIHRLKDKLGTRALPTAELSLLGTPARLVGEVGKGVKNISTLFNVTRIYNAVSALSLMRRMIAIARDYAHRREAFGKILSHQPLHLETLASLEVEFQAAFHLVFYTVDLLGKIECKKASEDEEKILRLLTPLAKLYTGKQCVSVVSEALECMGGAGYLEDTGISRHLRDGQVLAIWEGTTNVLSLDALRAIFKEGSLPPFLQNMSARLEKISHPELVPSRDKVREDLKKIGEYIKMAEKKEKEFLETGARAFAYSLSRICAATLMLEQGEGSLKKGTGKKESLAAKRWCAQNLLPVIYPEDAHRKESEILAL